MFEHKHLTPIAGSGGGKVDHDPDAHADNDDSSQEFEQTVEHVLS